MHVRRNAVTRTATVAIALTLATTVLSTPAEAGTNAHSLRAQTSGLAGTLVYIRSNNVWIARPDNTGARQLTTNGTAAYPYVSPSEDDAGHIVVGHLTRSAGSSVKVARFVRMDQSGNVLQDFPTPIASLSIIFARVSPNGSTIAYGALFGASDCADYGDCYTFFDHSLHYSSATGPSAKGTGKAADVSWANWAGNSRVILQKDTDNDIAYQAPTQTTVTPWFHTCETSDPGCNDTAFVHSQPTVDRGGDRYAASVQMLPWNTDPAHPNGQQYLYVLPTSHATTASPPPTPGAGCAIQGPDPTTPFPGPAQLTVADPTFSPDGGEVAFTWRGSGADSIAIAVVPDLNDCSSAAAYKVVDEGSQPYWSPAGLSAYRHRLVWARRAVAVQGVHRVGKRLSVATGLAGGFQPRASKVTYQWLRNGRVIKHATHRRYRVTARDRHRKLAVRITGIRSGNVAGRTTSRSVKIKR